MDYALDCWSADCVRPVGEFRGSPYKPTWVGEVTPDQLAEIVAQAKYHADQVTCSEYRDPVLRPFINVCIRVLASLKKQGAV
jgi:hypothetical protein